MSVVLLDATFLIDLMRGRERAVDLLERLENEGEALGLSAVTLFEFFRGLETVDLPASEKRRIAEVVMGRAVHPLDGTAAERAGRLDASLWSAGEPIDPEDACVAGTALSRDQELVTRKGREFGRVEGLRLRTY
jgi:predicted nucleic acid-binding protein